MQNQNPLIDNQKVESVFDSICQLRVAELRALQDMLVSRLSLKIIAPMAEVVEQVHAKKEAYEVLVENTGELSRVDAIKAVKDLRSLGLLEAKKQMENPFPWPLGVFETDDEAQAVVAPWANKGFKVSVK